MQHSTPTFGVKFLLFVLFFLGVLLMVFVVLDAEIFHVWIKSPQEKTAVGSPIEKTGQTQPLSTGVDKTRESIVLIESRDCIDSTKGAIGTGFIVQKEGNRRYVATNAHVIRNSLDCDGCNIIDFTGKRHKAEMVGISLLDGYQNDVALLKVDNINDNTMPPLALLNSSQYKTGHDGDKVITIGYPVPGLASSYDKASVSSEGRISQFDQTNGYFIASGLSLNQGNSGGPIFIADTNNVLGIAVAKADVQVAENVAMFIPIDRFKEFFKEKTGRSL
ncbi:MAG TPA: trypsin-like peptidase domain-containing protein [Candidatus Deferrimicrobium sp.]|nr:trypsin-like peptidase domain-containing protein [Candidatus Deferrimicrobium sp.]